MPEEEVSETPPTEGGRFDLVIEGDQFVLVVESKIRGRLGPSQLPKYRAELKTGGRFKVHRDKGIPIVIAVLTDWETVSSPQDSEVQRITWEAVQTLLNTCGRGVTVEATICSQFAEMLKEEGVAHSTIRPVKKAQEASFVQSLKFREEVEAILLRFRTDSRISALGHFRNKVYPHPNDNETVGHLLLWGRSVSRCLPASSSKPPLRLP